MEAIFKRCSVRKYTEEPVTDKELEQLLRAAMAAPSAKNSQNWLYFVQKGQGSLPTLQEVHPNAFALQTATAAIVVCADKKKGVQTDPLNDWWIQDCSAATENILLQAADLGLGSLWIGVWPDPKRVMALRKDLDPPEHILNGGAIALGHPAKEKENADRFDPSKVFYGKYQARED